MPDGDAVPGARFPDHLWLHLRPLSVRSYSVLPPFRVFWWNAARYVRRHRLLALANVLGIALGIAVYLAIRIANESANRSFAASVDLVAGRAHLEIRGDVEERVWPEVLRRPEVETATGIIEAVVALPDWPGEYLRLTGVDVLSAQPFQTYQLRAPEVRFDATEWMAQPRQIAVTAEFARRRGLQTGSTLKAIVDGRAEPLTVFAIIEPGDAPVTDSHFAAMDLGWMQELLRRPGKLTALQLLLRDPLKTEEAAAALQKIAPGMTIAPPGRRSAQMGRMLAAFQLNLTALSMVSLLVGVFLIYNTMSASVARRRVQIGILRALGLSAWRVRTLFLGEALLYAVPGVLLGAAGGVALAQILTGGVERTVSSLYALVSVERLWLEPWQFAVAAFYGLAAALVGAWGPAKDAALVEPADALRRGVEKPREISRARRWWVTGLAMLAAGAVCGWVALHGGPPWLSFGAALGVLLGTASFAPAALTFCGSILARLGGRTLLPAARRMARSLRRNAITAAALAAAVAMFVALVVMVYSFRRSLDAWIGKGIIADLFIAPAANETLGLNSYLPPEAISWLRARPEVLAADTFRERPITVHGEISQMAVVDGEYRHNLTFLDTTDTVAMTRVFSGEAAVVTEPFARRFGVGAGGAIAVETPRGPVELPIAGTYADYSRDQGVVLVSARWFSKYWDDTRAMSVAVYLRPGANAAALEDAFRAEFADAGQYAMHSSRALRARVMQVFDQTFAVTEVLRTVAIVVAVAGVFLTMTIMVVERRRELALLRALGGSPEYLRGLVLAEAGMLGGASAVLGVVAGIPLALVLTWVVNPAFFGWTIHLSIPWLALLATPLWITAAALAAAWWPSRVARRVEIAEALHEE